MGGPTVAPRHTRGGSAPGTHPASAERGLPPAGSLTAATACSSDQGDDDTADGGITLVVNGQPPQTQEFDRRTFDEDVAEFEAANPDVDIDPREGFMAPQAFSAKLAGGRLEKWVADFDDDKGREVLRHLKDMRWTDNTMGEKQLLVVEDVQQMTGAGRLDMYLAAPDNIPTLVNQFDGDYADCGLAAVPEGEGTLISGEGYMVDPKASPAKLRAALKRLSWKYLNPDRIERDLRRCEERGRPVGLPVPPVVDIRTGDTAAWLRR